MILDTLENAGRYVALNEGFAAAFAFLKRADIRELPEGKHEIDGDRLHATIVQGPGRKVEDANLETHQRYIDIQCILSGVDQMGWRPKSSCGRPLASYDPDADLQFFADEPDTFASTRPGAFAIFFPEDAHMPMISAGEIHKVIVKIAVDSLKAGSPGS